MFDALKNFVAELAGADPAEKSFAEDDYRLAAAALLVHVAASDGETDEAERRRLKDLIEERFGLDDAATRASSKRPSKATATRSTFTSSRASSSAPSTRTDGSRSSK